MPAVRRFTCYDCNHTFEVPYGTGGPGVSMNCPECGSTNVHRAEGDRGYDRMGRGRGGGGQVASPGGGAGGSGMGRGPGQEGRGRGGAGRGPRWA